MNIIDISSDNDSDCKLLSLTMTAEVLTPHHLFRDAYTLFQTSSSSSLSQPSFSTSSHYNFSMMTACLLLSFLLHI